MIRVVSTLETHRLPMHPHDLVAEFLMERVRKRELQFVVVGGQQSFEWMANN